MNQQEISRTHVVLTADQKKTIKEMATTSDRSFSAMLRRIIRFGMDGAMMDAASSPTARESS